METRGSSGQFRFKINDASFTVSIEKNLISGAKNDPVLKNMHYHAVHELFFAKEFPVTLYTPDSVSEYSDCLLCVPPFAKHCTYRCGGQRILFAFKKLKKTSGDFYKFMEGFFSKDTPFSFSCDESVFFYAEKLASLFTSKNPLTEEIAGALLKMIFYNIYISQGENEKTEQNITESYIVKIDNILTNIQQDINLTFVAEKLCLSTKQTSRIIKKHYKKTLSQLVNEKRLTFASQMLLKGEMTVLEIVEKINFPSESYFYSQFKKAYGCTPSKYKKLYK